MSRPKPTILLQSIDSKTFKAEQVLQSDAIYAVFYENQPINLRSTQLAVDEGAKYKKCSFSNPGHAFNLCAKLNALFRTDKFTVVRLEQGETIVEHGDCDEQMSRVHAVIIAYVRAHLADTAMAEAIGQWDDAQLVRRMFCNYRGTHGLRLSLFGHQMLQRCFEHFAFACNGEPVTTSELMYLDSRAKLPYFRSPHELVLYDPTLAVRLRLVDSDIRTLMQIDSPV